LDRVRVRSKNEKRVLDIRESNVEIIRLAGSFLANRSPIVLVLELELVLEFVLPGDSVC
jgi:hypothetical protein